MTDPELVAVEDADSIARLARLAAGIWHEYFPPIIGQQQVDYMVERFQSEPALTAQIADGYRYFFIRRDDRDIGYAGLVYDDNDRSLQISKLYLSVDARGGGNGRAALGLVADFARGLGAGSLWLTVNKHNDGAIGFYEKMGFEKTESLVMDIGGGFVMDDYRMEKNLI